MKEEINAARLTRTIEPAHVALEADVDLELTPGEARAIGRALLAAAATAEEVTEWDKGDARA